MMDSEVRLGEEDLTSLTHVGKYEVDVVFVPAGPGQREKEGMVQLLQDVPLVLNVLHLVQLDDLPQREDLHGVICFTWLV